MSRSQPFDRIKSLPPNVFAILKSKLVTGSGGAVVAKWLQEECKLFNDIKPGTLKKTLERYRNQELKAEFIQRTMMASTKSGTDVFVKRVNTLDEFDDLIEKQKERVALIMKREQEMKGSKILLKDVTREMEVLHGMLKDAAYLHMEVGLLARAPKSVKGSVVNPSGEVTTFSWTEEAESLYKEIEALRDDKERSPH